MRRVFLVCSRSLGRRSCSESVGSAQGLGPAFKNSEFAEREGHELYFVERILMSDEGKIVSLVGLPYLGTPHYWDAVRSKISKYDGILVGESMGNTQQKTMTPAVPHAIPNFMVEFPDTKIHILHDYKLSPWRIVSGRKRLRGLAEEAGEACVALLKDEPYAHTGLLYDPAMLPVLKERLSKEGYVEYSNSRELLGRLDSPDRRERSIVSIQYASCCKPDGAFSMSSVALLAIALTIASSYLVYSKVIAAPQLVAPQTYYASPPPIPGVLYMPPQQPSIPAPPQPPAPQYGQ
eukprot:TRINITY_DN30938_c0_g1_i1.p1 TRINITY_DN30938_c0_g1~~TRINITY_DN30938_c0_g1_i1.p1  ORF type:complete len:292 (+),score=56.25 TRINITY_DN30938_c0_g1_i1:50-925(+)